MVSILAVLILSSQIFHLYKPQNLQDNKKNPKWRRKFRIASIKAFKNSQKIILPSSITSQANKQFQHILKATNVANVWGVLPLCASGQWWTFAAGSPCPWAPPYSADSGSGAPSPSSWWPSWCQSVSSTPGAPPHNLPLTPPLVTCNTHHFNMFNSVNYLFHVSS